MSIDSPPNSQSTGFPQSGEFIALFTRLVVAVETIASSSGARTASAPDGDARIDLIMDAIRSFGNIVPTYKMLEEKTDIPASTLNGMPPVKEALRKARAEQKARRRAGESFRSKDGDFEAWVDPEDTE